MTEIVLAINEQDCTSDDGNTAEEFEAIAVTLLRAAEAVRNQEEDKLECFGQDGKALAWLGPRMESNRAMAGGSAKASSLQLAPQVCKWTQSLRTYEVNRRSVVPL